MIDNIVSKEETISICMEMIGYSGEGRSLVYKALDLIVKDEVSEAMDIIMQAEDAILKALEIQFHKLVVRESRGIDIPFSILLNHAMDQVMIASAEKDLVKTLIKAKM